MSPVDMAESKNPLREIPSRYRTPPRATHPETLRFSTQGVNLERRGAEPEPYFNILRTVTGWKARTSGSSLAKTHLWAPELQEFPAQTGPASASPAEKHA